MRGGGAVTHDKYIIALKGKDKKSRETSRF